MRHLWLILLVGYSGVAWADTPPPPAVQTSPAQLNQLREKNPSPVFPKSDVPPQPAPPKEPSFTESVSFLRQDMCFTFVPKASLLSVGNVSRIEVLPDHPSLKGLGTYVPAQEFIARFKGQFVVLKGTSLGLGKVSVSAHYPTPADKVVIAVDPSNVPAFAVVLP